MKLQNSIIAVTGANGFVGSTLCRMLAEQGAVVRTLGRNGGSVSDHFNFDLTAGSLDAGAFQPSVRAIIHCAYDIKTQDLAESRRINVEGTAKLIAQSLQSGVEQFVFISSMAAHADAQSVYGQTKWDLENRLLTMPNASTFSTVITPGTVIGSGGVFAQARAMVKKLPVIPVFYGNSNRRLQTVHIEDLCNTIIQSIVNRVTGRLLVADERGIGLKDFYRGLAALDGKNPILFPFPGDLALIGVRLLEKIGLHAPVSSSNLMGIKHLHLFDVAASAVALGCSPMGDFWKSLEKLAMSEGNPAAAERIRGLAQLRI